MKRIALFLALYVSAGSALAQPSASFTNAPAAVLTNLPLDVVRITNKGIAHELSGDPVILAQGGMMPGPGTVHSTGGGGGGIALVANVQTVQTTPSSAINTTGATLLVIAQGGSTAVGCCSTPTDSKSNTWTALTQQTATGPGLACNIYYAVNPTVGSGHTFTSGGGGVGLIQVLAFSGVNTVAPFDTGKENGASVNVATSSIASGGGFTPSVSNAVIIARLTSDSGSATTSIDGGFTISDSAPLTGGVNYNGGAAYLVQTSAAAANPSWTWSPPTTATGCTKLAAFVP